MCQKCKNPRIINQISRISRRCETAVDHSNMEREAQENAKVKNIIGGRNNFIARIQDSYLEFRRASFDSAGSQCDSLFLSLCRERDRSAPDCRPKKTCTRERTSRNRRVLRGREEREKGQLSPRAVGNFVRAHSTRDNSAGDRSAGGRGEAVGGLTERYHEFNDSVDFTTAIAPPLL